MVRWFFSGYSGFRPPSMNDRLDISEIFLKGPLNPNQKKKKKKKKKKKSSISGYFGCSQRKCTFRHVRPGNTWISLHLGIVSPSFAAHPKNLASLASLRDPVGYILALNTILFSGNPNVLSYFATKTCRRYSLEAPQWGASNKYPQHVFMEKRKIITKTCLYNFDPP